MNLFLTAGQAEKEQQAAGLILVGLTAPMAQIWPISDPFPRPTTVNLLYLTSSTTRIHANPTSLSLPLHLRRRRRRSKRHGGVQVRVGAMEEEAVGRDEVRAARALLGVPPAAGHRPPHPPHPPRQGPPPRLQGQAGRFPSSY
jgi:hypothetical protein